MGRDVDYQPCPISPRPGGKMKKLFFVGFPVATLVFFVLFLVFMGLYLGQTFSEPAKQLRECQSQMENQSAQMQTQNASLRRRVEETQEAAKKEAGILSYQMEAMNKNLTETQKNWHSCQEQLSILKDNFTSLVAEESLQTEAIKNLQQQLAEKSKQLNDEQRKSQEERKHHQAEIQQLWDQLAQKQQDNSNGAGGGRDLAGLSVTLLTIFMAGFLSV
ncbi:PREDICTED: uncharacterized protein LOC107123477 [Gekko japonicus]|uniref:Uncharacterized protein LOC107123477 n=1 Tax=Gekko japonicus TaxID=146911 RepID=A0ABM1L8D2_GEKJA|nr:PREDICTED: uncharacterized protein LOC107123477 [Gekko japonicus]